MANLSPVSYLDSSRLFQTGTQIPITERRKSGFHTREDLAPQGAVAAGILFAPPAGDVNASFYQVLAVRFEPGSAPN